jgi:hypothetical protein
MFQGVKFALLNPVQLLATSARYRMFAALVGTGSLHDFMNDQPHAKKWLVPRR